MRLLTIAANVAVLLCIATRAVRAESDVIALLPLDAEARLEAYGQPVASEIARALGDAKLEVVVVDAKMAMPEGVKLVVDGSITSKGTAVVLGVRVRSPIDGTTTDKLEEPAINLAAIGKAATKLSERLLPVVRARLDEIRRKPVEPKRAPIANPPAGREPVLLIGIGVPDSASPVIEPLRQALILQVGQHVRAARKSPAQVDASTLVKQLAVNTVASARAERGVVFEILDYEIVPAIIPLARARVRVRIADASAVVFDSVLATDTIVGDKGIDRDVLAARVAREVLTILRPHMRKLEPAWR